MNVIQDCIVALHAGQHGDIEVTHPIVDGNTVPGTLAGLLSPTIQLQASGTDWHSPLRVRVGDRLKTLKIRHFGNGASDLNVELRKWSNGVDVVVDTIVIVNPPAAWQTTTQPVAGTPTAAAGEYFYLRFTRTSGVSGDISLGPFSDVRDHP